MNMHNGEIGWEDQGLTEWFRILSSGGFSISSAGSFVPCYHRSSYFARFNIE
jgi:hypothetical protein